MACRLLLFLIVTLLGRCTASSQTSGLSLDVAAKSAIVSALATQLEQRYVLADKAAAMASYIKKRLKDGAYGPVSDPAEFSRLLNADLHSVYDDKHLSIQYRGDSGATPARIMPDAGPERFQNYGMKKAEILSGNVGYL